MNRNHIGKIVLAIGVSTLAGFGAWHLLDRNTSPLFDREKDVNLYEVKYEGPVTIRLRHEIKAGACDNYQLEVVNERGYTMTSLFLRRECVAPYVIMDDHEKKGMYIFDGGRIKYPGEWEWKEEE